VRKAEKINGTGVCNGRHRFHVSDDCAIKQSCKGVYLHGFLWAGSGCPRVERPFEFLGV
jgi:hypothetical protein